MLVHGIWMTGIDMTFLRHRMRRCGFHTCQFSYPSITSSVAQNARQLHHFVQRQDAEIVHLVGHSLGGLVIRQFIAKYSQPNLGRVVTLGTPHNGSFVARTLNRHSMGRLVLGRSIDRGLLGDVPPWQSQYELGSLAGNSGYGVGLVTPGLPKPNDGTVTVEETRLEVATDHIEISVSHVGLLYSGDAARQTCYFLNHGHFSR